MMTNKKKHRRRTGKKLCRWGTVVKTVTDLKSSAKALEKKMKQSEYKEVQEILETQKVIDEITVANSDAIKRISTN